MNMTWPDFYLICFLMGAAFSVVSVFSGHVGGHHVHGPHMGHGPSSDVPLVNMGTIAAFLVWFGGTGYLLVRYFDFRMMLALIVAILSGLAGASVVFLFLAKVLIRKEEALDPADYEMVGVLGHVASGIRPEGTGEIVFSQAGSRRAAPARSAAGAELAKGTEVVVTRYEDGIAYVQPWDELVKKENL
jgi:membrane protein implicated in regulation of membrane protease activity